MKNQLINVTKNNKRRCPEKLEILINRVNLFRPDEALLYSDISSDDVISRDRWFLNKSLHFESLYYLMERIENYPEEFQQYIYGREVSFANPDFFYLGFLPDLEYSETFAALRKYEEFIVNSQTLRGLIINFTNSDYKTARQLPYLFQSKTRMNIDENGYIRFLGNEFIEALEGVEISRIRICENCSRIFWAFRVDKKGCNENCCGNLRTKKSRELKSDRWKQYENASIKKLIKKNKR